MEPKVKMNVRTRKALEREMKEERKKYFKQLGKNGLKIAIKAVVILTVLLIVFVVSEIARFNKANGTPPGIVRGEEYTEDSIKYTGIFNLYTITYKYEKPFEEYTSVDEMKDAEIVSGELKLLDKKIISAWIK